MTSDASQPVYFHCSMCGECCSSWNIPIEGEKARTLLTRDWVQQRLAETHRDIVKISEDLYRLPLTDENFCIFLGEDRRCMVEANEGLLLKPHECQRFPFAKVRMPDGTALHDTSAACKQIAEKLLLAFQPILPRPDEVPNKDKDEPEHDSLTALRLQEEAQFDALETFPERVHVGLFRKVDQTDYERYLNCLHTVFSQPDQSSEAALKQAQRLLQNLPDSLESPLPQIHHDDEVIQGGRFSPTESHLHPSAVSAKCKPGLQHAGSSAFQFHPIAARLSTILFLRKPYRSLSWWSLLQGREYHDPRVFGFPVDLQARNNIHWDHTHDYHVNAFLLNLLNRRLLIARGHSLSSMLAMAAVVCLLVRWYATTLAWVRENATVEPVDVTNAIRLVERYYSGHQPRFLQFFNARWKGFLFERILLG